MKRYLLLLPLLASCATMRAAGPGLIDCAAPMMSTLAADVLGQRHACRPGPAGTVLYLTNTQ